MSNIRALVLPAELLLTTEVALNFRAEALREMGDKSDYEPRLRKILFSIELHQRAMSTIGSWTDDELLNATKTMDAYGGHFARQIAGAFYAADSHNRGVLVAAFAELFIKYGKGGHFYEER